MTDTVSVRRAAAGDVDDIVAIYVNSANAAFGDYQPTMYVTERRLARWARDLPAPYHRWWVAEIGADTAGFAGTGPSRDPLNRAIGELDTIAGAPKNWRHGVGRRLMTVVHRQLDADGYKRSILWTWDGSVAAMSFYSAMGWRLTDQRRDGGRQICFERERLTD
jgi:GNAT superfamily N-acetyltransferase